MNTNTTAIESTIDCPKCKTKIEVNKAMTAQLADRIRQEIVEEVSGREEAIAKQAADLAAEKAALTKAQAEIEKRVKDGLEAQRTTLVAEARKKAEEELAIELRDRDERVTELEGKLKTAQATELSLRKREREFQEKSENLELEVTRRVDELAERLRSEVRKQAAEEFSQKDKASQEQIASLQQRVDELKAVEEGIAAREQMLKAQTIELTKQKNALAQAEAEVAEKVKAGIDAERAALLSQAKLRAEEELGVELRDRADRVTELEGKLKTAQATELDLRRRERELKDQKEAFELETARLVSEAAEKARVEAKKQAAAEQELKDAENEQQKVSMKRQIEDLRRQIEQGPQQRQGEALEVLIEDALARAFPFDRIEPIAKGVHGADVLQHVVERDGLECGSILWETKNAKKWNPAWIGKLKADQRNAKAPVSVLVTEVMPNGCDHLSEVDGVWVCMRACAVTLGAALRMGLVELAKSRQAADGKQGKIEQVYDYLSGSEFRQRVAGVVEPLIHLQQGIDRHRRAMERVFAGQEKQVEAAILSMTGMYGDLQGIVGSNNLPTLEQMDLPRLEAGVEENGHPSD